MRKNSPSAGLARFAAALLCLSVAAGAGVLFAQYTVSDGFGAFDLLRVVLIMVSTCWLAWGASLSILGLLYRMPGVPRLPEGSALPGRTAILVPVYNEDPQATMARVAAIDASLARLPEHQDFHFAVLSDTRNDEIARQERYWFERIVSERQGQGRMFYRRRADNKGRKAGNIGDFIRRSGSAYEFVLILDADSLMEGQTIVEMVRRMAADPGLGLLQSLPKIINAQTLFGRALQFASNFFSPIFSRGVAMTQGREGPFWGHNALVRTRAFAQSCGLPELSGPPPFGGHILSHDYVEAALLARAGWRVRLDPDLQGSYEEGPETLVDYAKRDRRWCQGNLQHSRLLLAPGFSMWSRFVFLQGIVAYVAPLLWGVFLITGMLAPLYVVAPDYFPEPYQLFPVFPSDETSKAIELAVGIFGLLVLPKLAIALRCVLSGHAAQFGGAGKALASSFAELALSSLTAPLMLAYQSRSVLQVMFGFDGGWPAADRGQKNLPLSTAWAASNWIVALGVISAATAWYLSPGLLPWLLPVALPLIAAPLLIYYSSMPARRFGKLVFETGADTEPGPVIAAHRDLLATWQAHGSEGSEPRKAVEAIHA